MDPLEIAQSKLEQAGIEPELMAKWQALTRDLAAYGSAVVAFSGGVDSTFLSYAAHQVLGSRMIAVMVVSQVEPKEVVERATQFVTDLAIPHDTVYHDPLQNPQFQSNPADRCYHCKTLILKDLWNYARQHDFSVVLEGQNADDQSDYRPGRKAVSETGTFSPLANNNLTKAEIRKLAKTFDLSIWDKPSSPCLASRIPYGTAITQKALDQIDQAERYLHANGFEVARVRYHSDLIGQVLARIEIEPNQFQALLAIHEDLVQTFKQIGFLYVSLDLKGFRSGSLNEGLKQ
jgi:uncharacterized protein